jgi:hypothetical protein
MYNSVVMSLFCAGKIDIAFELALLNSRECFATNSMHETKMLFSTVQHLIHGMNCARL